MKAWHKFLQDEYQKRHGVKKYPLRKVDHEEMEDVTPDGFEYGKAEVVVEVLECGHRMRRRQDAFGQYRTNRRRCSDCYKELQSTEAHQ